MSSIYVCVCVCVCVGGWDGGREQGGMHVWKECARVWEERETQIMWELASLFH